MKRLILLLSLMGIVVISGCIQQGENKYVCPDGSVVLNPSLCPIVTTITGTTTPILQQLKKFDATVSCDNTLEKLTVVITNKVGESVTLYRVRVSYSNGLPKIMEVDPNTIIDNNARKIYDFPSMTCPNSVNIEITYIDSTGSHKDTGAEVVVKS